MRPAEDVPPLPVLVPSLGYFYRWGPGAPTEPFAEPAQPATRVSLPPVDLTSAGGGVNVTLRAVHGPPGIEAEPEAGTPSRRHGCAAAGGTHHHLEDR